MTTTTPAPGGDPGLPTLLEIRDKLSRVVDLVALIQMAAEGERHVCGPIITGAVVTLHHIEEIDAMLMQVHQ